MFRKIDYGFVTDIKMYDNGKDKKSYVVWDSMIKRCYNPKNKSYKTYGARGVTICNEWKLFSNFDKWFNENYIEGYEIDKDTKGDGMVYSPENCIFISKTENTREANARRDYSSMMGDMNAKAKDKKHYETFCLRKNAFKSICKRRGWNYDDFEEIDSGERYKGYKKYYYKERV